MTQKYHLEKVIFRQIHRYPASTAYDSKGASVPGGWWNSALSAQWNSADPQKESENTVVAGEQVLLVRGRHRKDCV